MQESNIQEFDHPTARSGPQSLNGKRSEPSYQLRQMILTGKIPNALLFYGAQGTGKKEAAMEFVKSCNCSGKTVPCNLCISCKKINTGMHPDMIFLEPENNKKNISIAQIRDVSRRISARANEADYRMVCILGAGRMNIQAQNGLLKVLEEPPAQTFFMLLATETAPLLPTILSRCRKFRFCPASPLRIAQILTDRHGVPETLARIISGTAGPDLDLALKYAGKSDSPGPEWMAFRQWLIRSMVDLVTGPGQNRIGRGLALSQKLSGDPKLLLYALAIVRTVLRDLCVLKYTEQIVNLDFFDIFKDISQTHVYPTFLEWMTAFCETEKRLDSNSGQRLALDRFFLELSLS